MLEKKSFRRTTIIIYGFVAFLLGIGLARAKFHIPLAAVIISLILFIFSIRKNNITSVVSIIIFGLLLGGWRGQTYMRQLASYQRLSSRTVTIMGIVDTDGIYGDKSQLTFDISNLVVKSPYRASLAGKIAVKGYGVAMVYKGDRVKVTGKLYPTRGSHQASISYAQIVIVEKSGSSIQSIKRRFEAGMQSALPEPEASFALGLLIGQRSTLPAVVSQQLSASGLTHIVAVSGYNLTIIVLAVRQILKMRSKYQITIISFSLIFIFLLFTGLSASIVRAAIVSGLSMLAWYYGRHIRPLLLISLAAAITAGWNPFYAWSDIGWYLSFLAFFGILILAPLLLKRIFQNKQPQVVVVLIVETMSAQIMTVPLIIYIFGQFSVVALIANLLIVPLVPLAMLLSLVAGLAGFVIPHLAGWITWMPKLLLAYMLDLTAIFSKLPFALVHTKIDAQTMVTFYMVVLFLVSVLWFKTSPTNAIITEKNISFDEELE